MLSPFKKHNYVNISKALEIIYANCKITISIAMKAGEKKKNSNIHIEAHINTCVSTYVHTHTYMHICTKVMIN